MSKSSATCGQVLAQTHVADLLFKQARQRVVAKCLLKCKWPTSCSNNCRFELCYIIVVCFVFKLIGRDNSLTKTQYQIRIDNTSCNNNGPKSKQATRPTTTANKPTSQQANKPTNKPQQQ
ncbi:unnamed protein product [Polarella glacialis]|uniref:Uncharacterized protein n=1 Tax=Polarella glacialis TaxID=89957 RepID=A0A813IW49_POLGL|nr:unnamed protein product [Polarella glacialis]